MSATDFRALIDIHGGHSIAIECADGTTIELTIDGERMNLNAEQADEIIIPAIREHMTKTFNDGFKKFAFGFGAISIDLNYYDAGLFLDTLTACVKHVA